MVVWDHYALTKRIVLSVGWEHVGYRVARQRGDVIAVERTSDNASGHCAIAVSDTLVMGASQDSVTRGTHGLGSDATIRRYTGW